MQYIKTEIPGLWIIEPKILMDPRGYFMESFKKNEFETTVGTVDFIQENESKSSYGVLRGLHFQKGDFAQAKLVRVLKGSVLDVAVDIREGSETYGKHVIVELSEENKKQFFIPRGFAHGFLVTSPEVVFLYKVDNVYSPENEGAIIYNDPDPNIQWPVLEEEYILSEKDKKALFFKQI